MRYFLLLLLPSVAFANGVEIDKPLSTPISVANGGTGAAPGAGDQVVVSDSTSAATWKTLTDCDAASSAMTYDTTTNAFGCNTISSATTVFPSLNRGYFVSDLSVAAFNAVTFPAATVSTGGGAGFATIGLMSTTCGEYYTVDPPAAGDYAGISTSQNVLTFGASRPIYAAALVVGIESAATADSRTWYLMASNDTAANWKGYDSSTTKVYVGIRQSDGAAADTSMMCCSGDGAAQSCTTMNYDQHTTNAATWVTIKATHGTSVVCNAYNPLTGALLGTATHSTNVSPAGTTNLILGSTNTATTTDKQIGWRLCAIGTVPAPGTSAF